FISGTHTLNGAQFTGAGLAQVDGGTAVTTGNLVMGTAGQSGVLEVLSGTLTGNGTFTGLAVLNWTGGTIGGAQTLATGALMNVSGSALKSFGSAAVFTNAGTVYWTGPGAIFCDARGNYGLSPSTFNNVAGGVFRMGADGTVFDRSGDYSTFNNQPGALFVKSGGTNETVINSFIINNRGEIRAETGSLAFTDAVNLDQPAWLNGLSRLRLNGNVMVNNNVTLTGTTRLDGGGLTGVAQAKLVGNGTLEWLDGTIGGALTLGSSLVVNVTNAATKSLGSAAVLNNEGTINWMGPGQIFCDGRGNYGLSPSVINNRPGATFAMLNGGTVFARFGDYSTFVNLPGALFVKSGGAANTLINAFVVDNQGELGSTSGILEFTDRTLLRTNGLFTGPGGHLFSGGTHSLHGSTRLSATTVTLGGAYFSGDINAALTTTNNGMFNWSGGTIGGDFTLAGGSTMNILGAATKAFDSAAVFHNRGTIHWLDAGEIWSDGRGNYGYVPATFNNEAGALFSVENNAALTTWGTSHTFNNLPGAIIRKSGATGASASAWNLNNQGMLELQTGTLAINAGYTTASSAQFKVPLGGPLAGTQFGMAAFTGLATFAGQLTITLTNGFTPTNGQAFQLATFPAFSGQFDATQLPPLPAVSRWQLIYHPTDITLQVVPANVFQSAAFATNGLFQITFTGQTGSQCVIDVSTNLLNWWPLTTNAPFNGVFNFSDAQTPLFKSKYYRATIYP
ncbi:MAG TPA: hypothetical protein VF607_17145, partial [Verrucomicrobiae bacterium]